MICAVMLLVGLGLGLGSSLRVQVGSGLVLRLWSTLWSTWAPATVHIRHRHFNRGRSFHLAGSTAVL